jgi:hypothetical protein
MTIHDVTERHPLPELLTRLSTDASVGLDV